MHKDELREFAKRTPFVPFDVKMSDGRVYTIEHPEWLSISPSGRTLVTWTVEDERLVLLDVLHITAIELRNSPTAA
jgi:hypothetical protein